MDDWKPIETAPKDGTAVLLWVPPVPDEDGKDYTPLDYLNCIWASRWDAEWQAWDNDEFWDEDKPTHWILAPEAPKV